MERGNIYIGRAMTNSSHIQIFVDQNSIRFEYSFILVSQWTGHFEKWFLINLHQIHLLSLTQTRPSFLQAWDNHFMLPTNHKLACFAWHFLIFNNYLTNTSLLLLFGRVWCPKLWLFGMALFIGQNSRPSDAYHSPQTGDEPKWEEEIIYIGHKSRPSDAYHSPHTGDEPKWENNLTVWGLDRFIFNLSFCRIYEHIGKTETRSRETVPYNYQRPSTLMLSLDSGQV